MNANSEIKHEAPQHNLIGRVEKILQSQGDGTALVSIKLYRQPYETFRVMLDDIAVCTGGKKVRFSRLAYLDTPSCVGDDTVFCAGNFELASCEVIPFDAVKRKATPLSPSTSPSCG